MLREVAAGDRQDQADCARKLLAEPEQSPAIREVPVPPRTVSNPQPARAGTDIPPEHEEPEIAARNKFLQENFTKFVPARFEKDGPSDALLQRVPAKKNMFDYEGVHYCGFRFTVPSWIDGHFQWMYLVARTEEEKDVKSSLTGWYIVPKTGTMNGFQYSSSLAATNYPKLKEIFPSAKQVTRQALQMQRLKPGQEYAIWFTFTQSDMPDIAFALSIQSPRGKEQFGELPLH